MRSRRLLMLLWPLYPLLGQCAASVPGGSGTADVADGATTLPDAPPTTPDAASPADVARADRPRATDAKPARDAIVYPPVKCADNLIFCEDFEAGALDPARWTFGSEVSYYNEARGVALDVDAAQARGKRALRLRRTEPLGEEQGLDTGDGFKKTAMRFPLGSSTLFVRFFIFIDDPTPNRWYTTFFLSDPAKDRMNEVLWGPALIPVSEVKPSPSVFQNPDDQSESPDYVPLGSWSCWEIELRGADKLVHFYLDGKPVRRLETTGLSWAPDDVQLNLGYHGQHEDTLKHPPDGFFDIWFDDIAVSKERIGCGE